MVVRDTDGSAFITKAEFDALKNSFQKQVDNYNTSIDAKIDGSIASYLAGVQISARETINTVAPKDTNIRMLKNSDELGWKFGLMKDNGLSWAYYRGYRYSESWRDRGACAIVTLKLKTSEKIRI